NQSSISYPNLKEAFEWYNELTNVKVSGAFSNSINDIKRTFSINLNEKNNKLSKNLYTLLHNDLISISDINIYKNGNEIPLSDLSSGQLCIISSFSSIAANIKDSCIIFIDEPEISLHPSWSSEYINLLQSTFSKSSNCHFIIATHSPHIVSRLPDNDAFVVTLKSNGVKKCIETTKVNFKANDFQLAEVF